MEKSLSSQKCVPCQGGVLPFDKKTALGFLKKVNGWELLEGGKKIQKKFVLKDFVSAIDFVNKVAEIAESNQHHPDIFVSYNKVTIIIFTHKIGGLHENDFILAAKIDLMKK